MPRLFLSILFFLVLWANSYAQENAVLHRADSLFNLHNYESAFRAYGNAMRENIGDYYAFLRAAECAYILDYEPLATSYLSLSLQKGASVPQIIEVIGKTFCKEGSHDDCLTTTLRTIAEKHESNRDTAYFMMADYFYRDQDYKSVLIFADSCFNETSKMMIAKSLFFTEKIDSAQVLYDEISTNTNNTDALLFSGNYHLNKAKKLMKTQNVEKDTILEELSLSQTFLGKAYEITQNDYIFSQLNEIKSHIYRINKTKKR